jgi:hypothetical protein
VGLEFSGKSADSLAVGGGMSMSCFILIDSADSHMATNGFWVNRKDGFSLQFADFGAAQTVTNRDTTPWC